MIAFDIDGVLADARHREHHLQRRPRDWDSFFAAAKDDPVIPGSVESVRQAQGRARVVLVSGRPERLRETTLTWLARAGFPQVDLYLRSDEDRRPAAVIKAEILSSLGGPSVIREVHEDDPAVIAVLERDGYRVFPVVAPGTEVS